MQLLCAMGAAGTTLHAACAWPQVLDYVEGMQKLMAMGYSPAFAAGALVVCKNDVTQASELCMSLEPNR
jgi:hypothetical protein